VAPAPMFVIGLGAIEIPAMPLRAAAEAFATEK
jgi:hypothetical protein